MTTYQAFDSLPILYNIYFKVVIENLCNNTGFSLVEVKEGGGAPPTRKFAKIPPTKTKIPRTKGKNLGGIPQPLKFPTCVLNMEGLQNLVRVKHW